MVDQKLATELKTKLDEYLQDALLESNKLQDKLDHIETLSYRILTEISASSTKYHISKAYEKLDQLRDQLQDIVANLGYAGAYKHHTQIEGTRTGD